ncbi:hypothetical protein A2U01_0096825, partial [Trifolium medium]|nr:hypothetical protein [Trifolium medium]
GYEHGEALVVSSGEPEESVTHDSGDARDGGELGDFGWVVSEELERSCGQGGDHGGYMLSRIFDHVYLMSIWCVAIK